MFTARKAEAEKNITPIVKSTKRQTQKTAAKQKKISNQKIPIKAANLTTGVPHKPYHGGRPRTVRETQNMLRILNHSNKADSGENEAESTAAFFQNSPGRRALKQIEQVHR